MQNTTGSEAVGCVEGDRAVRRMLAGVAGIGFAAVGFSAVAAELPRNDAGITGFFDTTVSAGVSVRVSGRDDDLIGVTNGGNAHSVNGDDGNLNYDNGDVVSANVKVTHELLLNWRDFGFFGRAFYFYDHATMGIDTARTPLSNEAEEYAGRDFELRDAYVTGDFKAAGRPLSLRLGNQVINWGESVFIRNGLSSINPVDVARFRIAGAEVRDGLVPVPALDVDLSLTDNLSLEGFYQAAWEHTEVEPAGTFFSTSDFASPGGEVVHLGFGLPGGDAGPPIIPPRGDLDPFGACAGSSLCSQVPRAGDRDAGDGGQFGLALRYFAPRLNDTEFGFYYARIHSRQPLISGRSGNPASIPDVANGGYAASLRYFREFPEDIDLFGASFNTEIGLTGVALQGELSYRRNQPLQVDDVELLFAALSPADSVLAGSRGLPPGTPIFGTSQLGAYGPNEEITGYRRKDVVQAQAALSKSFGPRLGSSQVILLAEVGATLVRDMESKSQLRYNGPGTDTSGSPAATILRLQPATQDGGFADPFSWGYRILARATYNNVIDALSLTPQIAFSHDVNGTAPGPIGNFVEGRKALTLSVRADYLNSLEASLSYTNSFGGSDFNLLSDRDFVALTVRNFF